MNYSLGICSWSLSNHPFEITQTLSDAGISYLHLEVVAEPVLRALVARNGWTIGCTMLSFPQEDYSTLESIRRSGGIVPSDCWPLNRRLTLEAIDKTAAWSVPYLSFHAGFIDHADAAGYETFCSRMRELADAAQERGIMILLETGQESAPELRGFLEQLNHPALGVNFDPANMILYGKGDPIEAVQILAPWIRHVHIKDAVSSEVPGEWGSEVPWGDGEVGQDAFLESLAQIGYTGALAIEREGGDARRQDIMLAVERLGGGK